MPFIPDNLPLAATIALWILTLAMVIALVRLAKGPTVPDRVVALDVISTHGMGMLIVYAVGTEQSAFLDVAIGMALILFLGTVAFARYLERSADR